MPETPGKVLVITPTYNERENLPAFVERLFAAAPAAHLLIVDDASPDGTAEWASAFARHDPRVFLLRRPGKLGLASAYRDGFAWGLARDYALFAQADADLSHRPEDLPALLAALGDADVAVGSRRVPGGRVVGWSLPRRVLSGLGSLLARFALGLPTRDLTSGYKAFRRRALEAIRPEETVSRGYGFQIEMNCRAARAGLRVAEVPITFPDRRAGRSKMSPAIAAEAVRLLWTLRKIPQTGYGQVAGKELHYGQKSDGRGRREGYLRTHTDPDRLAADSAPWKRAGAYLGLALLSFLFLTAATAKIIGFREFEATLSASRLVPYNYVTQVASLVIAIEVLLAALLWRPSWRATALHSLLLLVSVFIAYTIWRTLQGIGVPCHCFGVLFTMNPWQSVLLNVTLLSLIVWLLVGGKSPSSTARPTTT